MYYHCCCTGIIRCDGFVSDVSSSKCEGTRCDEKRNCGDSDACGFLCRMAESMGPFNQAKEVWKEEAAAKATEMEKYQASLFFPIGEPNDAYARYFSGKSFLAPVSASQISIHNVTFAPGCQNNWHIHHAKSGGGQILICVGGRGWYQEWGKEPAAMKPGDCVNIPVGVKHWHGAAEDSWFSHLAIEIPGEETSTEWLEASR